MLSPGAGVTLEGGEREQELGTIEGRSNKLRMHLLQFGDVTDNVRWAEWVVKGQLGASVELALLSPRGGNTRKTVTLG